MQLTVAVCTYNPDRQLLLRTIEAIAFQLSDRATTELVVVDNNSTPPLLELGYLDPYPVRLIRVSKPGLTAAREAAMRSANGEVILFVDDDNILARGYLDAVLDAFAGDRELGLLGGRVVPEYVVPPPRWAREFEPQLAIRRHAPDLYVETTDIPYSEFFPVGAGFAVRRSLALAYLDDCARTARIEGRQGDTLSAGEDTDLGLFVLSTCHKLAVSGALSVTHVIPSARLRRGYLEELVVGSLKSTRELETKWAARFGRSVFPELSLPMLGLLARLVATAGLRFWSPRYAVKYAIFRTLMRFRLNS